jgi:hypothetical protein
MPTPRCGNCNAVCGRQIAKDPDTGARHEAVKCKRHKRVRAEFPEAAREGEWVPASGYCPLHLFSEVVRA